MKTNLSLFAFVCLFALVSLFAAGSWRQSPVHANAVSADLDTSSLQYGDDGQLLNDLLYAIQQVETGGEPDPANAVGDGGKALGPFQIHRPYWEDACKACDGLADLGYESVKNAQVARLTVISYWQRYNGQDLVAAIDGDVAAALRLARMHNGGPRGHKDEETLKYASKVLRELKQINHDRPRSAA